MIGKVTRGSDVGGLLRYLYGPGRANEHTNPHLVASWNGDDPATLTPIEPVTGPTPARRDVTALTGRLSLPLQLQPDGVDRPVWQCSMRTADTDRRLTDTEWASVARDVVDRVGIAPAGDPGGCRWVAVRHADDHVHIVAVLARQDGAPVRLFRDWPKVHAAARAAEQRLGLTILASPDRSAEVDHTRAETEKATRADQAEPARRWLTRQVRVAAAGSTSRADFAAALGQAGVSVTWRESVRTPGQVTGYAVGRPGDVDGHGRQVWFSGSKLCPDLSLPKLQARWRETDGPSPARRPDRRPNHHPGHRGEAVSPEQRRQALEGAARALGRVADGRVTPVDGVATAEVATVIAHTVEGPDGGPLTDAARHLAHATRQPGGRRPDATHQVHVLRHAATGLADLGRLLPAEAGDALLIVGQLLRITALIRDVTGRQRQAAAHRATRHLTTYTGPPGPLELAALATLPAQLRQTVLHDPAWPALAGLLRDLDRRGVRIDAAVRAAAGSRDLADARSVAAVLHHRLLTTHPRTRWTDGGVTQNPTRTRAQLPRPGPRRRPPQ